MDPITHAASGALLAYALPAKYEPETRLLVVFAALMAASPDVDVFFATLPVDYILLHRGITHSLVAVPILALLWALLAYPLYCRRAQRKRALSLLPAGGTVLTESPKRSVIKRFKRVMQIVREGGGAWTFPKIFALACACLLLHIWLDVVTTYGTMIFLPFSEYRVRLNGVFIVDILLTLPLLLTMWHGASHRPYAIMGLIWICIYPAACVGVRYYHEAEWRSQWQQEAVVQERGALVDLMVFPDALAPWNWRVVYETQKPYSHVSPTAHMWAQGKSRTAYYFPNSKHTVHQQGFTLLGEIRTPLLEYAALDAQVIRSLEEQSRRGRAFMHFLVMPIAEQKALMPLGQEEWGVYDLRFSSMVPWVHALLTMRNGDTPTFLLEARRPEVENAPWDEVRLLLAGTGQDSGWQKPEPHSPPAWWRWLLGVENY